MKRSRIALQAPLCSLLPGISGGICNLDILHPKLTYDEYPSLQIGEK